MKLDKKQIYRWALIFTIFIVLALNIAGLILIIKCLEKMNADIIVLTGELKVMSEQILELAKILQQIILKK
jgi:hypothetical protein